MQIYRTPPMGGAKTDYETWALQVSGVTRAWCTPNGMGTGTVVVHVMLDEAEAAHDGFPQGDAGVAADEPRGIAASGDQLIVANHIYILQPVTALVYVAAPIANTIDFTITNLGTASSVIKQKIAEAIADVFFRNGQPGGTIDLSDIEAAIASINGTQGFVITSPSNNIANGAGELPVLGTVTYG